MTRILEFPIEILGSSPRMTQKAKPEDNREFRIPRDCFVSPLNDENSRISKDTFRIRRDCFASPLNDENSRIPSKKYPAPRASGCEATSGCEAKKKPRNSRIP